MIFIYLICLIVLINLITQIFFFQGKRLKGFYRVNLLLVVVYNTVGWWYIIKYLGEGGASLGPGLTLIFFSGVHLVIIFLFFCATLHKT